MIYVERGVPGPGVLVVRVGSRWEVWAGAGGESIICNPWKNPWVVVVVVVVEVESPLPGLALDMGSGERVSTRA